MKFSGSFFNLFNLIVSQSVPGFAPLSWLLLVLCTALAYIVEQKPHQYSYSWDCKFEESIVWTAWAVVIAGIVSIDVLRFKECGILISRLCRRFVLLFLHIAVILWVLSNFLEFFHKLGPLFVVTLLEKIVLDLIEFFAVDIHCNFIFVLVNLVIDSLFDLTPNPFRRNLIECLNYALGDLLILQLLHWIDHTIWVVLFDHR